MSLPAPLGISDRAPKQNAPQVRDAYRACLDAIPADVTGCEEGPLDPELDARLETLALRFPRVIGVHLDNTRAY